MLGNPIGWLCNFGYNRTGFLPWECHRHTTKKNDGIIGGAIAHSARGPWPRLVTTGVVNLKKKLFERKRSLCCESFLAGTQVQIQNLFIITVGKWSSYCQPREHLEQLCFSAHWTYVNVFWTEELCRVLFLPICTCRIYSVHVYIFSKINQPFITPPPTPGRLRNGPPDKPWHATCAPRSSHW